MCELIFILIFGISCNQTDTAKIENKGFIENQGYPYFIDLGGILKKPQSVTLSEIGKELEYIPLETKQECLVGEIYHLELTTDFIFVGVRDKILQFDRKGKFVRQIGSRGRGPGEYMGGTVFCADQKNGMIYISKGGGTYEILKYNFKGEYIKTLKKPWDSVQFLAYNGIGLAFYLGDSMFSKDHFNLYITDLECNLLFSVKRYLIRKSNYDASQVPLYNFNGLLHFKQFAVDTMYILKDKETEPYAIFNLGKLKMEPNIMASGSDKNVDDMLKQFEDNIEIDDISENGDYIFTKMMFGFTDSAGLSIFNKHTSETSFLKDKGFINDIDGGINFWPKFVYNDSILVDYYNSFEFLNRIKNANSGMSTKKNSDKDDRLVELVNSLDEMSNPIIILIKSK